MRAEHQDQVRSEVTARVVSNVCQRGDRAVADTLHDALYHERMRLERQAYAGESGDLDFWRDISRRLGDASANGHQELLRQVTQRFVNEVMGNFNPRIYEATTRVMPTVLAGLLNSLDPRRVLSNPKRSLTLHENVSIKGEIEAVKRLSNMGTLVVVPTHLSNLDSIILGYAAFLMGLPPLTYGAGLNLFTNKFFGFFMNRLGAYRVDRRKKASLYKDVLKEYATIAIELGYHNLFFPAGTRVRSGAVETHLKKGLLGTGLRAYMNNLKAGRRKPNVYYVPCTISYALVLEARTLIEDHLKEAGKSRYIITDDEFSRLRRIAGFMRELLKLNSRIYLTFGQPLDPFGNRVDFQGRSIDGRDRPIDIERYVTHDGRVVEDAQRDHQYTSELSDAIVTSYRRNSRLQSTNLVAFTAFRMMRDQQPDTDLYRLLRTGHGPAGFPLRQVTAALEAVLAAARIKADHRELLLDPELDGRDAASVLSHAVRAFGSYHRTPAVRQDAERIHVDDRELALYYHNRALGYGLERVVTDAAAAAAET